MHSDLPNGIPEPFPLRLRDLRDGLSSPLQQWLEDLKVDQPTRTEIALNSRPIVTSRHAPTAVFERWDNSEFGVVVGDPLR